MSACCPANLHLPSPLFPLHLEQSKDSRQDSPAQQEARRERHKTRKRNPFIWKGEHGKHSRSRVARPLPVRCCRKWYVILIPQFSDDRQITLGVLFGVVFGSHLRLVLCLPFLRFNYAIIHRYESLPAILYSSTQPLLLFFSL